MLNIGDKVKTKPSCSYYPAVLDEVGTVVQIFIQDGIEFVSVYFPIYGCTQGAEESFNFEVVNG